MENVLADLISIGVKVPFSRISRSTSLPWESRKKRISGRIPGSGRSSRLPELRRISQLDQGPHVAFHVGLQVLVVEPARFETLFVKARKESAHDQVEGPPRRSVMPELADGGHSVGIAVRPANDWRGPRIVTTGYSRADGSIPSR